MQDRITPLISKILASYQEIGGINNIDGTNLPSKRAITQICEDLLQILFPGFHDEKPIATEKLPQITSGRILSIVDRLRVEAFKSLRLNEPECPSRRADQIVLHLIGELQPVREILQTDVEAAYEGDPASTSYNEIIVSYPCCRSDRHPASGPYPLPRPATPHSTNHDGMGPQPDGNRHSSRGRDRQPFFYRSRDRRGDRRNLPHRFSREAVPRGHARRAQLPERRRGKNQERAESVIRTWETG